MELLSKLGIDWKLLIAQIVNFAILVGMLTYFVYKPLLNLLDERRAKIAKAMEDAKKIEDQKKDMEVFRTEQLKKIDQEIGDFLERAKKQAEAEKVEIVTAAQKEAQQLLAKAKQSIEEERSRVLQEVQGSLTKIILKLTEKLLEREFSPTDQKRILTSLEKEIPTLAR